MTNTQPLVSVIVPVYGVESCLARCLDSILSQTLRSIEVVCVDDGSPDRSIDILKSYARHDERIIIVSQPNRGLGAARNTGLQHARGRYVTFVDSDDCLGQREYLERLAMSAEEHHVPLSAASILKHHSHRKRWTVHYESTRIIRNAEERLRCCNCPPDFYVWNKLYLRSRLDDLGMRFPEGVIFEDVLFTLRALCEMGDLIVVADAHYDYIVRPKSLTKSRNSLRKQRDRYQALSAAVCYCDNHALPLPEKRRSIPVRSWGIGSITLLKLREKDGRRSLRLFDFITIYSYKK